MAEEQNLSVCDPGSAKIKSQYVVLDQVRELNMNFIANKDKISMLIHSKDNSHSEEPPKKKLKGQNKYRPRSKPIPKSEKLCFNIGAHGSCSFGDSCCYSHNVLSYLEKKPKDIGEICYLFETFGYCPYSFSCRFASKHISEGKNVANEDIRKKFKDKKLTANILGKELQKSLRRREYDFSKSEKVIKLFENKSHQNKAKSDVPVIAYDKKEETLSSDYGLLGFMSQKKDDIPSDTNASLAIKEIQSCESKSLNLHSELNKNGSDVMSSKEFESISNDDSCFIDTTPLRLSEMKKIDFRNKLYLAPLTTVGNLPFRRICKELGADITCGEMAMALNLLQGQQSEWALLKRHHTEDIFGIQLCGAHADVMTRCSQLITENVSVDFIDINMGCPIEIVYKKGAGCGLMQRLKKLEGIIYGVSSVINVPLTLKMRTGVYGIEKTAHTVINKIHQWGDQVELLTLHGRSREQRYTKSADWNYISYCNELAHPIPLLGNGDILSYEDYNLHQKESNVAGVMIARGALIKPWIFKEIKEQIHWDISSSERFDLLKTYVNYGLEHWGSDTEGVEKTRRFLLEWLSFLYRYIPVGLLECVPQHVNERPPPYHGRNDMETLMASPSCADWIKISEMLLGPVPENFSFLPKHKANAYQ